MPDLIRHPGLRSIDRRTGLRVKPAMTTPAAYFEVAALRSATTFCAVARSPMNFV